MIIFQLFWYYTKNVLNEGFNDDDPLGLMLLRFNENGPSVVVADGDVNDDENWSLGCRRINLDADINDVEFVDGLAANGLKWGGSVGFSEDSKSDPSSG